MRLSKPQKKALRKARYGLRVDEVNGNGNRRRTYLSLLRRGLLGWNVCGHLAPTEEAGKLLESWGCAVPPSAIVRRTE